MHTFIEHIHIWGFSVIKHDLKNNNLQDYKSEIYIYTKPIDIIQATIYI